MHITLVDDRDNERKIKLAAGRARSMNLGEHYLDEAIRYAKEHDMLLHTGDMIDFVSEANLDAAARHYCDADWFVSAGNHEFSQYVGEAKEDDAYKAESYQKVQEAFPNDLTFCSRIYGGVNFVSLDDVYCNVTERQHELMEQEVKRGLPIVLMCHVPFYIAPTSQALRWKSRRTLPTIHLCPKISNGATAPCSSGQINPPSSSSNG